MPGLESWGESSGQVVCHGFPCRHFIMQTVPLNCSNPAPRHGKLGLASFFIAIFAAILCAGGFLLAGIGANSAAERGEEMPRAMAMVAGSMILGACFIAFIGFCLGVAGLFQKNTKKVFAIVGVVLPRWRGWPSVRS